MEITFVKNEIQIIRLYSNYSAEWNHDDLKIELDMKKENDNLLQKNIGKKPYSYSWGKIDSIYDDKNTLSYIF
jgi:hypothetical protein